MLNIFPSWLKNHLPLTYYYFNIMVWYRKRKISVLWLSKQNQKLKFAEQCKMDNVSKMLTCLHRLIFTGITILELRIKWYTATTLDAVGRNVAKPGRRLLTTGVIVCVNLVATTTRGVFAIQKMCAIPSQQIKVVKASSVSELQLYWIVWESEYH